MVRTVRGAAVAVVGLLTPGFGASSNAFGGDGRTAASAHAVTPLAVGERVPSVVLKDIDGNPVEVDAVIGSGHVALIFYRGGWCPYCNRQLSQLRKIDPELRKLGFRLVAISADRPRRSRGRLRPPLCPSRSSSGSLPSDSDGSMPRRGPSKWPLLGRA
jgi:thiol-disulfide isomerase/thioredoxin